MNLYGAIEGGGTKFVCGVGTDQGEIVDRVSFPTTSPEATMRQVIAYFEDKSIAALGVGSFGPIDVNAFSSSYGVITNTPKPQWKGFSILKYLENRLSIPIRIETDVNVAALGEATWGAGQDTAGCLYITVGTGIGVGLVSRGEIINGFTHPEMGHIPIRRNPMDLFEGACPYHRDCLEGLASGQSIELRWGRKASELPPNHDGWKIEADYLAQGIMTFILVLMPQKIIVGGGVGKNASLIPSIRLRLQTLLNNYIDNIRLRDGIKSYIVPPALQDNAGLAGCIALVARPQTPSEL